VPFARRTGARKAIGSDALTGVNDADDRPPFTLTGKLNKVMLVLDPPKLTPEDSNKLAEARRAAEKARE
jgi:arylsulfatase